MQAAACAQLSDVVRNANGTCCEVCGLAADTVCPLHSPNSLARPSVCPSVPFGLLTQKQTGAEKKQNWRELSQGRSNWCANLQFRRLRLVLRTSRRTAALYVGSGPAYVTFHYGGFIPGEK